MPDVCVAANCSNVKDEEKGISLHKFPGKNDKARRSSWARFVSSKRSFKVDDYSYPYLCSEHFKTEDFINHYISIPGTRFKGKRELKRDAVPSIQAQPSDIEPPPSKRAKHQDDIYVRDRNHRKVYTRNRQSVHLKNYDIIMLSICALF